LASVDQGATVQTPENTIGRFEKKAGLVNGRRMSGREPSGELRVAYSKLLKSLVACDT
jgi:hypothetical protein